LVADSSDRVNIGVRDAISVAARPCDYGHPANIPGGIDPTHMHLQTRTSPTAAWTPLTYVANAAACGTAPAWFIDNPSSPSRASLCPATCEEIGGIVGHEVWYFFDCGGTPPPRP
jgi:hypothetical protein